MDKHFHFELSLLEKLTDLDLIKQIFPKFELIKSIELRENEKKQQHYSLNYVLEDKTFIVISVVLNGKPLVINAFHVHMNYENFEKSLIKQYGDKFI